MAFFNLASVKPKSAITLLGLVALGATAASAIACAPLPDPKAGSAGESPPPAIEQPADPGVGTGMETRLTPEVERRILQTVASEVGRPVADLRIADAAATTWDGCMGIYVPDQMCTMIAIDGLRLVVTDGDRSWVYHSRSDGQGAVQNPTASGSRNGLIPDFIPRSPGEPNPVDELESHLFRSLESGSLSGAQREIMLLDDGRLLHREGDRVVAEKRVSPAQLTAFQQVLEDQRFPNLNQVRYVTDAAWADYPTVQLSAMHYRTVYIDLALEDAPTALQAVVQAWDTLVEQAQ